ncbi:DUF3515 family protein [Specibacter sp. NPDC057265]|uniref:DUF3515 family protein n=1 Tax=Specibacter sp. NPDC057265 TaxID=3346075 RepID=UPI00363BA5AE
MRFFASPALRSIPVAVTAILLLSACSPKVTLTEAADANNPACAPMMVALPDELAGASRRATTAQATAAWGEPAAAVLRCGVQVPGPTTDRCVTINGVDWVIKEGAESWTFTSYGRDPATELVLEENRVPSDTALSEISAAVAKIPADGGCVGREDLPPAPAA